MDSNKLPFFGPCRNLSCTFLSWTAISSNISIKLPCSKSVQILYAPLALSLVDNTVKLPRQLFSHSEHFLPHAEPNMSTTELFVCFICVKAFQDTMASLWLAQASCFCRLPCFPLACFQSRKPLVVNTTSVFLDTLALKKKTTWVAETGISSL